MKKWRVRCDLNAGLFFPEYKSLLFWHDISLNDHVQSYMAKSSIAYKAIAKNDTDYYFGVFTESAAIQVIQHIMNEEKNSKNKAKDRVTYLDENCKPIKTE